MVEAQRPFTIREYRNTDYEGVVALFVRINRELAPANMRELFEQYIATAISGELRELQNIFSEAKRNAFWVVEIDGLHRGRGIAQRMLQCAEARARDLGFSKLILSTAEVQEAAIAFYRKSGYRLVRTEVADAMSTKTVGGGLTRFHFEKPP
jgi:GNAT superfamily N-acetyltransferase